MKVIITVNQRGEYEANVLGEDFVNANKGEIQRAIRAAIRQAEDEAGYFSVPVAFEIKR